MKALRRLTRRARKLFRRDRRVFLLRTLPKDAVCAEIGVWKGEFSRRILDTTHPRELHLIDPWQFFAEYPTRIYGGAEAKSQDDMDRIYANVVAALGKDAAVRIHRKPSSDAALELGDETLDWIYIDGNHSYEHVLGDLERFHPKVKPGGLLTGDDYRNEVKRAVTDFVATGRAKLLLARKSQFVLLRLPSSKVTT